MHLCLYVWEIIMFYNVEIIQVCIVPYNLFSAVCRTSSQGPQYWRCLILYWSSSGSVWTTNSLDPMTLLQTWAPRSLQYMRRDNSKNLSLKLLVGEQWMFVSKSGSHGVQWSNIFVKWTWLNTIIDCCETDFIDR